MPKCRNLVALACVGVALVGTDSTAGTSNFLTIDAARQQLAQVREIADVAERRSLLMQGAHSLVFLAVLKREPSEPIGVEFFEAMAAVESYLDEFDPLYTDKELIFRVLGLPVSMLVSASGDVGYHPEAASVAIAMAERSSDVAVQISCLCVAAMLVMDGDWEAACRYSQEANKLDRDWLGDDQGAALLIEQVFGDVNAAMSTRIRKVRFLLKRVPPDRIEGCASAIEDAVAAVDRSEVSPALLQVMLKVADTVPGLRIYSCNSTREGYVFRLKRIYWEGYVPQPKGPRQRSPWIARYLSRMERSDR